MHSLLVRLLVIVMVALAPGLLVQIDSESQTRRTRQQLMEDQAIRLVRIVSEQQQRINEGADQLLTAMGSGAFTIDSHPEICQRLLANILNGSPRYLAAAIVDPDGRPMCRSSSVDPHLNLSERNYFHRALRTGAFTVGGYSIGLSTWYTHLPPGQIVQQSGRDAGRCRIGLAEPQVGCGPTCRNPTPCGRRCQFKRPKRHPSCPLPRRSRGGRATAASEST